MKNAKLTILTIVTLFCTVLTAKATFFIQQFTISNSNTNGNLIVDPSKVTNFRANYTLTSTSDNMYNSVTVDVIYVANDLSETTRLGTAKSYSGDALPGRQVIDFMDVQLPANKVKGRIFLRVTATSPQTLVKQSTNSFGIQTNATPTTPTTPVDSNDIKLNAYRNNLVPPGVMKSIAPPFEISFDTSLVRIYLVIKEDGTSYDFYPNFAENGTRPAGWFHIRVEFFAFKNPVRGAIPIYRFVKKSNKQTKIFSSIREQDESIWEYKDIAFYAYPNRPRANNPPGVTHIFYIRSTINPDLNLYTLLEPDPKNPNWVPPFEIVDGLKLRRSILADFCVFPAYSL